MKDWPDNREKEPEWKLKAEFAVLSALLVLMGALSLWLLLSPSSPSVHP